MYYWGRQITRAIVKAFPAHHRGNRGDGTSPGRTDYRGPRLRRSTSAWSRIRAKDTAHRGLLTSPLRWLLVLALGYTIMETISESFSGFAMVSVFLVGVLYGAAFSRRPTFRIMCSAILLTASAAFCLYDVELLRVAVMVTLALALMTLAVRTLPVGRGDRMVVMDEPAD